MNLAGNQAKQLLKSLRTGSRPSVVGLWAAATAVDQMRKRSGGSGKELIAKKKLKPGQSYVIRMPGTEEGSLASSLAPGTVVAEIETNREESIPTQLLSVATELLGVAAETPEEPSRTRSRQRRRTSLVASEEESEKTSRRQRRQAAKATEEPVEKLSRRQRRAAALAETEEIEPAEQSFTSSLLDVAASFMADDDELVEEAQAKESRRRQRRSKRLASLESVEFDRDILPRRQRRQLNRAERKAHRRPSRKRVRRARMHQKRAAKESAKIARRLEPSRRRLRQIRAAEREVEYRQAKVDKKSTRRRRRKLKSAEKTLKKLT